VEAILDGRQPAELQLDVLLQGFSVRRGGSVCLNTVRGVSKDIRIDN
jgi:hypothetical protein